jgi:hypothetical protein
MGLQEMECGSMDWIHMAQDAERWRALVNAVMKLRVLENAGNFLKTRLPSPTGLCSMQ